MARFPTALTGTYVRTGPNPASGTSDHWFFGDGMVHGVRLAGGKAEWYRNRFVQTPEHHRPRSATRWRAWATSRAAPATPT